MWGYAFWIGMGQVITVPIGVLITAILTRSLPLKEFGLYQLLLSYIAAAKITTLPGMTTSLMKSTIKGYDGFFYKAIKLSFYTSLIGSAIFLLGGAYLVFFKKDSAQWGFLFMITGIIFPVFTLEKSSIVLIAKKQFKASRQWAIIGSFFSLGVIGLTAYLTKNLVYTFIANCLVQIATLLLLFFIVKRHLLNVPGENEIDKNLFRFGWKMTFINIFGFIIAKIDKIIIGIINPALLAIYYIGAKIPEIIEGNSREFLSIPTVHWSALNKRENVGKLIKYWWIFILAGGMTSLFIWILAPWFIVTFFGESYKDSIFICRWLSIGIAPLFLRNIISNIDIFQEEGKYFRRITVLTQIIYIILLCFLIRYKTTGIVISVLFSEFILFFAFIGYFLYLYRRLRTPGF